MAKNIKYRDKHTLIGWQKELNKEDFSESSRTRNRKNSREFKRFCFRMSLHDKDWWDCVSENDKYNIWHNWDFNNDKYIRNFPKFLIYVKNTYKIDQSLYRDKKINRLLNDK